MVAEQALEPTRAQLPGSGDYLIQRLVAPPESSEIHPCLFLPPVFPVPPERQWGAQDAIRWGSGALCWP